MEGISKQPVPYILEADRNLPASKQTIFYIKPRSHEAQNRILARYSLCRKEGRKGDIVVNTDRTTQADLMTFEEDVVKIENYKFSADFPKEREKGWIKEIKDTATIRKVCQDFMSEQLLEIWEAASDIAKLKAGEKKG